MQNEISDMQRCRTCLAAENLTDIFQSRDTMIKRMQQLKLTTGLEIKQNDGFSQKICVKCLEMMLSAFKFRHISLKTHNYLLKMKQYKECYLNNQETLTKGVKTEKNWDHPSVILNQNIKLKDKTVETPQIKVENNSKKTNSKPKNVKRRRLKEEFFVPYVDSYTCEMCERVFTNRNSYIQHLRLHSNGVICELCGMRCRDNATLQSHKRAKHGFEKIFKCSQCDKSFAYAEAFRLHKRTHTGEKPFICDHCGDAFHRRDSFVQHLGIHSTDITIQCNLCPKRFKAKVYMKQHKYKVHSAGRTRYRYICPICGNHYQKKGTVKKHAKAIHNIEEKDLGGIDRFDTNKTETNGIESKSET